MMSVQLDPARLPESTHPLRRQVRQFLARQLDAGRFTPSCDCWFQFDSAFSRLCGEQGWLGMTWPTEYGGRKRTALERYVVVEELLAIGAPVGAHWIAERQSGPQLLRFGSERAKRTILPRIASGKCYFAPGLSEPDCGSDLAAVRTRAARVEGGWRITGTKIWTSHAHRIHYLLTLARTSSSEERHAGLTQFICDLAAPGVTVRPIYNIVGGHDFNEVVFDEYFVPDDMVLGEVGAGWSLVNGELAFERSGPDRFLSAWPLLRGAVQATGSDPDRHSAIELGRLISNLAPLRSMSISIAAMLERGEQPNLAAALVKDVGTSFERDTVETVRRLAAVEPSLAGALDIGSITDDAALLGQAIVRAPVFTLRGGTREIMRDVIAKGLGAR